MPTWAFYTNAGGLICDAAGFCIIARELLKKPDDRLFLGGGNKEYQLGRLGFALVIGGYLLQLTAQAPIFLALI